MAKLHVWQILPYILLVVSYLVGLSRNKFKLPSRICALLKDPAVTQVLELGIKAARLMEGKSDTEKREYVRAWAKSELYKLVGEWLPDSAINYLIEHLIVRAKEPRSGRWTLEEIS